MNKFPSLPAARESHVLCPLPYEHAHTRSEKNPGESRDGREVLLRCYSPLKMFLTASKVEFITNSSMVSPLISAAMLIFSAISLGKTVPITFISAGLNTSSSFSFSYWAASSLILSILREGIGRPPENQPRAVCGLTASRSANQALSFPIFFSQESISSGFMPTV